MKIFLIFAALLSCGCVDYTPDVSREEEVVDPEPKKDQDTDDVVGEEEKEAGVAWAVSGPKNIVDAIERVLGDKGDLPPKEDLVINSPGGKLTVHPGSSLSYEKQGGEYLFVFNEPRPNVEASVFGWKVHPPLLRLRLKPDNSGLASVSTIAGEVTRPFYIKWGMPDEETGIAGTKPSCKVWCYLAPDDIACGPCEKMKKEFKEASEKGELPFSYILKKDGDAPAWMPASRPAFWWHKSKDQPSQEDVNNTVRKNGYSDLKEFLSTWKNNRSKS